MDGTHYVFRIFFIYWVFLALINIFTILIAITEYLNYSEICYAALFVPYGFNLSDCFVFDCFSFDFVSLFFGCFLFYFDCFSDCFMRDCVSLLYLIVLFSIVFPCFLVVFCFILIFLSVRFMFDCV